MPPTRTASGRIRCRRAVEERTASQSGQVSFGIVLPEVVPLGVGILYVGSADVQHLLQEPAIPQDGPAQFGPIPSRATSDHIVDGSKGESLMGQVSVDHRSHRALRFGTFPHTPGWEGGHDPGARERGRVGCHRRAQTGPAPEVGWFKGECPPVHCPCPRTRVAASRRFRARGAIRPFPTPASMNDRFHRIEPGPGCNPRGANVIRRVSGCHPAITSGSRGSYGPDMFGRQDAPIGRVTGFGDPDAMRTLTRSIRRSS